MIDQAELPGALTLEQRMEIVTAKEMMAVMDEAALKAYLICLIEQQMLQDNQIKLLLRM